ncbi:hypothetical protein SAMN04515667_0070 [Formosa sp. Hel1_31_208]|uniref:hypothetical protein n=1 Tax=Formosa sp. Hel1_31_208 TaxID=1798225 RepID=UPI00087D48FE|nr:hypothetical protein [Formosa sp. Hel1_31_208]SDR65947.1 hypothetical protein SAMN04515667_0070 [Formosa sp. Hel1_31_208]
MKKQLLLLSFACFLFAGSQFSFAQSKMEKQKVAIENADSSVKKNAEKVINLLKRHTKLDEKQKTKIYDIFVAVDKKMKAIETIENTEERQAKQSKMQVYINSKLQQVLSPEQYKVYIEKQAY